MFFHFMYDDLAVDLGTNIAREIIDRGLDIMWLTYARLEKKFAGGVLPIWYEAGARVMEWGLESASKHVLLLMNKGIEVDDVQQVINSSTNAGILNKAFCFHNYPGETIEDLELTLNFLKKNILNRKIRPFLAIRNKLFLLKGSILYEEATSGFQNSLFSKVWVPNSPFAIQADYEDIENYEPKRQLIKDFLEEMYCYIRTNDIFTTDDENVTMDLLIIDLLQKGYQVSKRNI